MNKIISIKNFTKKFKNFVTVNNISFNVNAGSIHAFVGPNGSGKTTTIKTLIGAYTHESGTLKIDGHDAGTIEANKKIGYVPESASFPHNMNAIEYLEFMGSLAFMDKQECDRRIEYFLRKMNLWDRRFNDPSKFSSGMQKKLLIIQSILHLPKILILDEPTANLDPTSRDEVIKLLLELNKEENITIFISSHILSELEQFIDSITFLYYGNVLYSGSVKDLYEKVVQRFYLESNNNERLLECLKSKKFNTNNIYFEKNKLILENISDIDVNKVLQVALKNNILINSLEKNNLQDIYNFLIKMAK